MSPCERFNYKNVTNANFSSKHCYELVTDFVPLRPTQDKDVHWVNGSNLGPFRAEIINFRHLISRSSIENLTVTGLTPSCISPNGYGSLRRRASRRSSKKIYPSPDLMSREDLDEVAGTEAEKLLDEREAELRRRLQGFENGTTK